MPLEIGLKNLEKKTRGRPRLRENEWVEKSMSEKRKVYRKTRETP